MQVLLVHPDSSRLGGIESYIQKITPHLTVTHESCGNSRRPGERGALSACKRILGDYFRFTEMLRHKGELDGERLLGRKPLST